MGDNTSTNTCAAERLALAKDSAQKKELLSGKGVIDEFINRLIEKKYITRESKINIYRCFDSWDDAYESGTTGINFHAFYLVKIPETRKIPEMRKTFALLKGKGVTSGRGSFDIDIDIRLIDVTDICTLCKKWKTSQEGMVDIIIAMLTHKLEIPVMRFRFPKEWHFPRDHGLIIKMVGGHIFYEGILNRFETPDGWKPKIVDYITKKFINNLWMES